MKHCKYFFLVYAIAILSSVGANGATVTGLATPEYVKGAINSLDVSTATGSGNVVTSVTQEDGKIKVTKGTTLGTLATRDNVTETQISGNIGVAKITGAQTTGNLVDTIDKIETNKTSTTKYPSMAVAQQIASTAAADKVSDVTSRVDALETDFDALTATVEENKGAAEDAIKGLTGTGTGATDGNGMVKTVTQTNGVVTATRGLVETADISDGAVDGKKIKDGAVTAAKTTGVVGYIPSGSATATTYAQIWVQ